MSISDVIAAAKQLKEISDKLKNAELMSLIADLQMGLADVRMELADAKTENIELKNKIRELESVDGEPCPRCHKRGWNIESSGPDPTFGDLGAITRIYKCSKCGFTEPKFISPS